MLPIDAIAAPLVREVRLPIVLPPEYQCGQHCGQFRPDSMGEDQRLHPQGVNGRMGMRPAAKQIA
ncbi:hypothetical protein [Novosphingobium sp. CCH12-A3]|uniref:hypothetical protein n=1 Tax=Novosphingobium sp. CCH12-A3 TaxID=1768752 RepID=UPI0007843320|nr:hypothetical protein [Novosphingobium sp. CCH12-A3]